MPAMDQCADDEPNSLFADSMQPRIIKTFHGKDRMVIKSKGRGLVAEPPMEITFQVDSMKFSPRGTLPH